MSNDETDDYIPVELVAELLDVSRRQATRYAQKVRTQQDGRRILYHRGDIERIAKERDVKHDRPLALHTEILPPGRLVDLISQLQQENSRLNRDNGRLAGLLEVQQQQTRVAEQTQRQLAMDTDETRLHLVEMEARAKAAEVEAERLRAELEHARRSWWRRLFTK
jgi:hypothetical protein